MITSPALRGFPLSSTSATAGSTPVSTLNQTCRPLRITAVSRCCPFRSFPLVSITRASGFRSSQAPSFICRV